jgi:8-oxo-dGTP diphosphatase
MYSTSSESYTYTLAFIKKGHEILMINRHKKPWQGAWNGVGGKRLKDESPIDCIKREIYEETHISLSSDQITYKGYLTWNLFDANGKGLYLYLVELPEDFIYQTPKQTQEGILDWKSIQWIVSDDNYGVAHNIPYFLPHLMNDYNLYHYHCVFSGRHLIEVTKERL